MAVRLILIRHAKSDWTAGVSDRERPLNARGRRQAPATGEWLAEYVDHIDLAVVSVATRAQQTWERVAEHLDVPTVIDSEEAYTFDGDYLADVVADLPDSASTAIVVGHNPALEVLIHDATGLWVPMPTSAVAVLHLSSWGAIGEGTATVEVAGRPADDSWHIQE